ncbi:MAG: cation-translocating P-type ATPase [Lachnospiraceae bacterium]|nr:cation-translocating P-type ATPase [Lachnospiraceae bacterium]
MKEIYQMSKEELYEQTKATDAGLTSEEAKKLLEEYGKNTLKEEKKKSIVQVFAEQFKDLLVLILIIAAVISIFSGSVESSIVIFVVIIMNAILGTVQYAKAQKSLDSLKALSSPHAKVLRDGIKVEVMSEEIVPGDILELEAGDLIAADGRIIANYSLQVNESSLTGESTNVDKSDEDITTEVALADRINMVFSGSLVTYGRATVLVTGTGMNTEIGKIADLMNATKEKKTPLQVSLDDFSKKLALAILGICVVVFGLGMYHGNKILDALMFAVALAVAAIPEALSSIVTIVQAIGTQKMAKENAVIKELKAVESLGCVSVICSDKTGTLTQNKMTVQEFYIDGDTIKPSELKLNSTLGKYFLYNAILNNDSSIVDGVGIGDPTEYALLEMCNQIVDEDGNAFDYDKLRNSLTRLAEIPFDSDRKIMSVQHNIDGKLVVFTKGALDVLLDRSDYIQFEGGVSDMTIDDKSTIMAKNMEFSQQGLRVLAFAYKIVDENYELVLETEQDFTFLGLISMIDPPREESMQAVAEAKGAGIKTVMITGDHKVTATAIAKQIGLFEEGDISLTGQELDDLTDEELDRDLTKISVYARVSPENKIRIVDAWQRKGHITSMTGDGVNDAPSLKKADIGVAMGITGTEVSKDAASMILQDDNFATIIKAVLNGRNIYRNIKNAIEFLLSGNMAGIITVLYCSLMGLTTPFSPVHLLFINLLTDSLPALAIGMEPSDKSLLKRKPRDPKENILNNKNMVTILLQGALIAISTIVAFYIGLKSSDKAAMTMAFSTLALARLFHGFNCRSEKPISKIGLTSNMWTVGAFAVGVALLSIVLFVPALYGFMVVEKLDMINYAFIAVLAFVPTIIIQIKKTVETVISEAK